MSGERYGIVVTAPAARVISEALPEAVAFAVIDFMTGPLWTARDGSEPLYETNWKVVDRPTRDVSNPLPDR